MIKDFALKHKTKHVDRFNIYPKLKLSLNQSVLVQLTQTTVGRKYASPGLQCQSPGLYTPTLCHSPFS